MRAELAFHDLGFVGDGEIAFAVIAARHRGRWIFCRHRERETWEMPGGHREPGETALEAAKRELYEETGAVEYTLETVCVYAVTLDGAPTYGTLSVAEVTRLGPLPDSEIGEIRLFDTLPGAMTYPEIQPVLMQKIIGLGV